jgi:hypothetical protein
MVPGIAERERRIADAQRRDWLAEVVVCPAKTSSRLARGPGPSPARGISRLSHWRRRLPRARDFQLAINVARGDSTPSILEQAPAE